MRKLLVVLLSVFVNTYLISQDIDRSKAPKPGLAPEINIGIPAKFVLENGLKVFVVENHKLPTVSFQLTVDMDPVLEKGHVGLSSMMGDMLSAGTTTKTKSEIDQEIDFIGASFSTFSNGFYASSLTKHIDKVMSVASDVILNPAFPEEELEKKKKRALSGLKSVKTNADAISSRVGSALKFGKDHPYGEVQMKEDVENISIDLCKEYYKTYFRPNISYLVIVGDISLDKAKELSEKYFGSWEKADVPSHQYDFPKHEKGIRVAFVNKPGAVQSVISVFYPIKYNVGAPDQFEVSVMSNIFGGAFSSYLNANLREDKGYTYGARGYVSSDKLVGQFRAGASVRNEVTDSAVAEFLYEMNRIKNELVSDDDLNRIKNNMNGDFALSLERSQTIARFALNIERYDLPEDYYQNYLSNLQKVDKEAVQRAAKKYIDPDNCVILVVGNEELAETLTKFDADGEIEFFDINGDPRIKKEKKPLPEGLTAEQVVNDYLMAITGKDNLKDVAKVYKKIKSESILYTSTMEQQGQSFTMEMSFKTKAPNSFKAEVKAMGMVFQKTVFNGVSGGEMNMQTGKKDFTQEEIEEQKAENHIDQELKLKELGFALKLLSIEEHNGSDAYKIELTSPTGEVFYELYDVNSKLKVQEMKYEDGPDGNKVLTFKNLSDYKKVKNLMYPHTVLNNFGSMEFEMKIKSIEINSKFDSDEFDW